MRLAEFFVWVVLPLVTFVYYYLKKKFSYFEERGIPHVTPTWPMGNMKGISTQFHFFELLQELYKQNKGKDVIAGIYSFTNPIYLITDPELAKIITIKDFNSFMDRGQFVNEENEPLTGHLFALEGERWKYLRNKLSPAFTSGKIKSMFNVVSATGDNLIKTIERRSQFGAIETKDAANRFTVDVISSCVFGMEANTLNDENEMLIKFFKEIFGSDGSGFIKFILMAIFPKLAKLLRLRVFTEAMSNFFMNIVAGNIKNREENNDTRKDFLNMLIQLKNKGSIEGEFSTEVKKLTLNEVLAQAFLFFFAGSDTSSTTISFALCEIANNQEIQEKLRNEIIEKTRASNGELTYENMQEMIYLTQVMNETLRRYTPGFMLMRRALEDYKIPNSKHMIPKGYDVWIPILGFQNDEKYWKNPTVFNPDRFIDEQNEDRPSFAFMPFGEGPRNCIGMRFGQLNVKVAIAKIVQNFKITLDSRTQIPFKINPKLPNVEPINGFMLKYEKL